MRKWIAMLLLAIAAALFLPDPMRQHRGLALLTPNLQHWMGTDEYGRDLFARFLAGGAWSLSTGLAATGITLALGWIIGSLAGWYGRWVDRVLMAFAETCLSMPWLYLLIGLRAALPLDMPPRAAVALMLAAIATVSWARPARLVRGVVLSLSGREYVLAAKGFGVPGWRIFLTHILPATTGLLTAQLLEETVKVHVKHRMNKLGASDRTQPVAIAVRRGIREL